MNKSTSLHNALFLYHRSRNESFGVYAALENALCCDPDKVDTYYRIAGYICDELCARTETGEMARISVRDKERYVMPFILQAFINDCNTVQRAVTFLKKNKTLNPIPILIALYKDENAFENAFSELSMEPVNYCTGKREEILAMVESMPNDFQEKYL